MKTRTGIRSRLALVATLVMLTGSWTARSSHGAPCSPKKDHDLCKTVSDASGFFTKGVTKFVKQLQDNGKIGAFVPTPIPGGDPNCKVEIAPVIGSVDTPTTSDTDDQHTYVVAIIRNPKGCTAPKFKLKEGATAAWIVRFNYTGTPGQGESRGKSWIVGLGTGFVFGGDIELGGTDKWSFTHCASNHPPPNTDNATFYRHADLCPTIDGLGHDAKRIADVLTTQLSAKGPGSKADGDDDPAVWFRCGGDCCYADSHQ